MSRRKKKHAGGRPPEGNSGARYIIKMSPELLEHVRESAKAQGIPMAEWWRAAALRALLARQP